MKKLKVLCASAALVLVAGALVGCQDRGNSSSGSGTTKEAGITVWAPLAHQDVYKGFISGFKEKYPEYKDVDIKLGTCEESEAYTNVSKDVESAADVYSFANDQLYNLIKVGALSRVGGENETEVKAKNAKNIVDWCSRGDELYGYPITADNGYYMHFDKSVVTNYDEKTTFFDVLEQCAKAGKKFAVPMGDSWYGYGFFAGFGATYNVTYDDAGKETKIEATYNGEGGLKSGRFLIDMANSEGFQYCDGDASGDNSVFLNTWISANVKDCGAIIIGNWQNKAVLDPAWGENHVQTYLPLMKDNETNTTARMRSFAGGKVVGVNGYTKSPVLAHKFAAYISGKDAQLTRFTQLGMGPSNSEALETEEVKKDPAVVGLATQIAMSGDAQINVPSTFWTAVQNFGASVGYKKEVNKDNLQEKLNTLNTNITTLAA